jgi:alpha-L-fucosidase 2
MWTAATGAERKFNMRLSYGKLKFFLPVLPARLAATMTAVFLVAIAAVTAGEQRDLKLWYEQPAEKWTEALPVGNGRMGAMIFGRIVDERIQFNEDTLWRGRPHDYVRDVAGEQLSVIRNLIFEGKASEAGRIAREKFLSDPVRQLPYQPFGDLRIHFPGHEHATDYRRELDLDAAVARTVYRVDEVGYLREAFASHPDRAIVLRFVSDHRGRLSFTLGMDSPHTNSQTRSAGGDTLVLSGEVHTNGVRFESRIKVVSTGGSIRSTNNEVVVENADSAILFLTAATSFKNFQDISADPADRAAADLDKVSRRKFEDIRSDHVADHQKLFRRVNLDLGRSDRAELPTDKRLQQLKTGGVEADPALGSLHFQYGRYLLIASSRPGTQPANLQGVWNEELNPPWESKWTLNINCEMNYWLAELGNLSECHEPLFDMIDDLVVSGSRTARKQYGSRGWVVHHNTDLWRGTAPINNIDGVWPTGGAWLCHHLWERYLFTGDKEFLRRRAYPVMKQASLFFVDFLIKDPATGYLVTNPSHSPEQTPPDRPLLGVGPTMDNQLIRALFGFTIEAAEILGVDPDFSKQLAGLSAQLPPNKVGRHGQLQEWLEDVDAPNNNHRHMSPLFALYPGWEITPGNPRIYEAAKLLLKWRGDGSTGWSFAWRMPLWARVGDGDYALRQFNGLLHRRTLPNLFDLCGPFQIDGNFGAAAGVAEMLLQSHLVESGEAGEARVIDLLPALPKAWGSGSIRGLRARGGFEVDLTWENGALKETAIRSTLDQPCVIRAGERTVKISAKQGHHYRFDGELNRLTGSSSKL